MNDVSRPRLLFFRMDSPEIPAFVQHHLQEHVECLSQFFDVTVIGAPCDYDQVCDEHRPDLCLFESGVYAGRRGIANPAAHPAIPKLGFCHCDAYCETREVFISDMAAWGVEDFFTLSVSLASYTPALADKMFVWPNFVDPAIFRDYGLPKLIPVVFTGSQATHYPWRNSIHRIVSQHYPSLQTPHFGWSSVQATARMQSGEPYARMLNAALVAPTCGTIANEIVRKHFEIPACNTCLITQRTPALEAAGFLDQVNCLFVDETDVLDKLDWLFKTPDEHRRISRAGHDLVHARHTIQVRDQIYQWFLLRRQLKPHQKIVQLGPFLPLTIVDRDSGITNGHVESGALDRMALARGDAHLWAGRYDDAETCYRTAGNYHPKMPEPKLRLALCSLFKGNAELAARRLWEEMQSLHAGFATIEPDPVEWAYYIAALLCRGKTDEAVIRAGQFASLRHPELDRIRAVVRMLAGQTREFRATDINATHRHSVHPLPERSLESWLDDLRAMLKACRQGQLAERLETRGMETSSSPLPALEPVPGGGESNKPAEMSGWDEILPAEKPVEPPAQSFVWIRRQGGRVNRRFLRMARAAKNCVWPEPPPPPPPPPENKELGAIIRQILSKENIKSGLLIGASDGEGNTESFLAGMAANPNRPVAVCVNASGPKFEKLRSRLTENPLVQCCCAPDNNAWKNGDALDFDVVVIDASEAPGEFDHAWARHARFVVLDDINMSHNFSLCQTLLADRDYVLSEHNPGHQGGYAVFKRLAVGGRKT